MEPVYSDLCPICKQGHLVAVKNKSNGMMSLMCEECESQWASPEATKNHKNIMDDDGQAVTDASLDEVIVAGWMNKAEGQ